MPFYNPYMKTPDWGSGAQDIISQLMQMMMMNRMFPQNKTTESLGATEPTGGSPLMAGPLQGAAPPQMGQQQMDPQLMQILQIMFRRQQQQPPMPQFMGR